jgi:hypothetical protein
MGIPLAGGRVLRRRSLREIHWFGQSIQANFRHFHVILKRMTCPAYGHEVIDPD